MKNVLATIGISRFLSVAMMIAVVIGAMAATPFIASAEDTSDDGTVSTGTAEQDTWDPAGINWHKGFQPDDSGDFAGSEDAVTGSEQTADGSDDGVTDESEGADEIDGNVNGDDATATDDATGEDSTAPETGDDVEGTDESTGEPAGIDVEGILSFEADGQTLEDYLALFGLTGDELASAVTVEIEARIAAAVESGELTQEQADEILLNVNADIAAILGGEPVDDGSDDGNVDDGSDDAAGDTGNVDDDLFLSLEVVTELTGADVAEITAALEAGQTLAEFAADHGVLVEDLIAALAADIENTVAEAVASGALTQDQADEMLADVVDQVTAMVNEAGFGVEGSSDEDTAEDGADETSDDALAPIAEMTGTTAANLLALLTSGQALVDAAAETGVSVDELVAGVMAEVEAQVAAAIESGALTQEQADEVLGLVDAILTSILNIGGLEDAIGDDTVNDPCAPVSPNGATGDLETTMPVSVCPQG